MTTKTKQLKLRIQPVPKENWGDNLAHLLPEEIWTALRKAVHVKGGHQCQICGERFRTLHCHENWWYDDKSRTQTLASLLSICEDCHNCIHWFRTEREIGPGKRYPLEYAETLRNHYLKVNSCSINQMRHHLTYAGMLRVKRYNKSYTIEYRQYSVENITKRYQERQSK